MKYPAKVLVDYISALFRMKEYPKLERCAFRIR